MHTITQSLSINRNFSNLNPKITRAIIGAIKAINASTTLSTRLVNDVNGDQPVPTNAIAFVGIPMVKISVKNAPECFMAQLLISNLSQSKLPYQFKSGLLPGTELKLRGESPAGQ